MALEGLPQEIAGNEALAAFEDVGGLATAYVAKLSEKPDLMNILPDDIKTDPAFAKYKTGDEFVKGVKNLASLAGKKGIPLPKEGDAADMERFMNDLGKAGLGRPESADKYNLDVADEKLKAIQITDETKKEFLQTAHSLGLSNKQAQALFTMRLGQIAKELQAAEEGRQNAEVELRKTWGADFDKNFDLVTKAVHKFGGDKGLQAFGALPNSAEKLAMINIFASMAKGMSEDTFNTEVSGGGNKDFQKRVGEINDELQKLPEGDARREGLLTEKGKLYDDNFKAV